MVAVDDSARMRQHLLSSMMILLLSAAPLCAGPATPFRLGDGGGVIVFVAVSGHGPFAMLIDTGASHSAITRRVADAIGAPVVAQSNVISPISGVSRPIVAVEKLVVGPNTIDALLPSVVANGSFDGRGEIEGLVGQDVLAGLRYTLDFKRRVIEWHAAPAAHDGIRLPLTFESGRFLVNLEQASQTLRLVPDSGAGGLVLFESTLVPRLDLAELNCAVELLTADATQTVRAVQIKELRLGRRTLRNIPAVAISRPIIHPGEGDGLLPLHLFERVTFDGPSRLLIVT